MALDRKIGFLGAGNMAYAIAGGLLKNRMCDPRSITALDISPQSLSRFAELGCARAESPQQLAERSDILFIAVKPQNYEEALSGIAPHFNANTLYVSIAAGLSTAYVQGLLSPKAMVVRCMPNTPLLLGLGATAMCASPNVPADLLGLAEDIFGAMGVVVKLPESQMNAVISVNGSSPAYVFLLAQAMLEGAVRQGIDEDAAMLLIQKSIEGSAAMLATGRTPQELIDMVASKGGTTERALSVLGRRGFSDGVVDAMMDCTRRADELSL